MERIGQRNDGIDILAPARFEFRCKPEDALDCRETLLALRDQQTIGDGLPNVRCALL